MISLKCIDCHYIQPTKVEKVLRVVEEGISVSVSLCTKAVNDSRDGISFFSFVRFEMERESQKIDLIFYDYFSVLSLSVCLRT